MSKKEPTYREVINILKHAKRHQPFKTDSWSSADFVEVVWFSYYEGLLKSTGNGYELTTKGEILLNDE
jgi:hypothetical protein